MRHESHRLRLPWAGQRILGTFAGQVGPYWRSEAAIARAHAAFGHLPPDPEGADEEYRVAIEADRYSARPWRELADLHFLVWQERGAAVDDKETRWSMKTIPSHVSDGRDAAAKPRFVEHAQ